MQKAGGASKLRQKERPRKGFSWEPAQQFSRRKKKKAILVAHSHTRSSTTGRGEDRRSKSHALKLLGGRRSRNSIPKITRKRGYFLGGKKLSKARKDSLKRKIADPRQKEATCPKNRKKSSSPITERGPGRIRMLPSFTGGEGKVARLLKGGEKRWSKEREVRKGFRVSGGIQISLLLEGLGALWMIGSLHLCTSGEVNQTSAPNGKTGA